MESQFSATREELYHVQMDLKHVQTVQINHADRLLRLEKRQADDAALKSVWNSPFPSVLGGTPQQGSIPTAGPETFEDLDDELSHDLLGNLQLETEEEPVRRGVSRTNSVRFELSAIQGSNWAQPPRSSSEFSSARPNSGFGSHPMTERSLSHKSDGRHSSAGHSVHSIHSAPSGRTSSLGLDTNFIIGGHDDDSPLEIPAPPPGIFILGTVPSIIRCWLNRNFSHNTLLYAVICSGSQMSHLDISLVEELDLLDRIQKDATGNYNIRLPVYLPEALVTQPMSRAHSPVPQLPTMTVNFEVVGVDQRSCTNSKSTIRVFLGSDALRTHNADVLFSQNIMTLYGADNLKISVPFVRPEDDTLFRHLCTTNIQPVKAELKVTPLLPGAGEQKLRDIREASKDSEDLATGQNASPLSPATTSRSKGDTEPRRPNAATDMLHGKGPNASISPGASGQHANDITQDINCGDNSATNYEGSEAPTESERRESTSSVWGSWRTGGIQNTDSNASHDDRPTSGYNKAGHGARSMKILKPSKIVQPGRSSLVRTGPAYEPPPQYGSREFRRKSQARTTENNVPVRQESKRSASDEKCSREPRLVTNVSRSNPIGGASAFAWMATANPKVTSTATQ